MTAGLVPDSHPFFDALFPCRELIRFVTRAAKFTRTDEFAPSLAPSIERYLKRLGRCQS
jgi:hypothetical protein